MFLFSNFFCYGSDVFSLQILSSKQLFCYNLFGNICHFYTNFLLVGLFLLKYYLKLDFDYNIFVFEVIKTTVSI